MFKVWCSHWIFPQGSPHSKSLLSVSLWRRGISSVIVSFDLKLPVEWACLLRVEWSSTSSSRFMCYKLSGEGSRLKTSRFLGNLWFCLKNTFYLPTVWITSINWNKSKSSSSQRMLSSLKICKISIENWKTLHNIQLKVSSWVVTHTFPGAQIDYYWIYINTGSEIGWLVCWLWKQHIMIVNFYFMDTSYGNKVYTHKAALLILWYQNLRSPPTYCYMC